MQLFFGFGFCFCLLFFITMGKRKTICGHSHIFSLDNHSYCTLCRECSQEFPCNICVHWPDKRWDMHAAALSKLKQPGNQRDEMLPSLKESHNIPILNLYSDVSVSDTVLNRIGHNIAGSATCPNQSQISAPLVQDISFRTEELIAPGALTSQDLIAFQATGIVCT